ncbi:hypothetical protein ACJZ2D_008955 [Fusarium nematophilum]
MSEKRSFIWLLLTPVTLEFIHLVYLPNTVGSLPEAATHRTAIPTVHVPQAQFWFILLMESSLSPHSTSTHEHERHHRPDRFVRLHETEENHAPSTRKEPHGCLRQNSRLHIRVGHCFPVPTLSHLSSPSSSAIAEFSIYGILLFCVHGVFLDATAPLGMACQLFIGMLLMLLTGDGGAAIPGLMRQGGIMPGEIEHEPELRHRVVIRFDMRLLPVRLELQNI